MRPLSSIDHSLLRDTIDVRGWTVIAKDGAQLGTVAELIVDVEHGSPVYINVVPDGTSRPTDECWIRVPYRHAALDDEVRCVRLSDVATLGLGTASAGLAFTRRAGG
jgi:hypothetical protein